MLRIISAALITLCLWSSELAAQGGAQYIVSGGVAYPIYDKSLTRVHNAGLHLGLGLGFPLSERMMLIGTLEVSNLPLDDEEFLKSIDAYARDNQAEEGSSTALAASLIAKYAFSQSRSGEAPFLTAGLTVARYTTGDVLLTLAEEGARSTTVIDGKGQTAFGFNAGAGFNIHLSPKSFLFFEARYTLLFSETPRVHFIPLQMGVAFR